jgi:AbrB family looped-hinge helix DNA binding protein
MTLKIDRAGRIVVPKPVRERLGLRAGMDLEAIESSEGLILRPLKRRPSMIKVDGLWVHQGKLARGSEYDRLVAGDREERMRKGDRGVANDRTKRPASF